MSSVLCETSDPINIRQFLSSWDKDVYLQCAGTVEDKKAVIAEEMQLSAENVEELETVCRYFNVCVICFRASVKILEQAGGFFNTDAWSADTFRATLLIYSCTMKPPSVNTSSTMQNVFGPIRISHSYWTVFFFIFSLPYYVLLTQKCKR